MLRCYPQNLVSHVSTTALSPFQFLVLTIDNCNNKMDKAIFAPAPSLNQPLTNLFLFFRHSLPGVCGAGRDHGKTPGGVQHGRAAGEGRGEDSLPGGGAAGV